MEEHNLVTGLCAFPLTPLNEERIDEEAFAGIVQRLVAARVDSLEVIS